MASMLPQVEMSHLSSFTSTGPITLKLIRERMKESYSTSWKPYPKFLNNGHSPSTLYLRVGVALASTSSLLSRLGGSLWNSMLFSSHVSTFLSRVLLISSFFLVINVSFVVRVTGSRDKFLHM